MLDRAPLTTADGQSQAVSHRYANTMVGLSGVGMDGSTRKKTKLSASGPKAQQEKVNVLGGWPWNKNCKG